ncbi:hypothetical protein U8P71_34605 (plasmid) [Rhizobium ruizarguesonis]|nr:hypothetical protein U8P71_34605 [Rhizobium ruizarguesonis]
MLIAGNKLFQALDLIEANFRWGMGFKNGFQLLERPGSRQNQFLSVEPEYVDGYPPNICPSCNAAVVVKHEMFVGVVDAWVEDEAILIGIDQMTFGMNRSSLV